MTEHAEKFNITIEEFLDLLSQLLDDLHDAGLSKENGLVMETVSLLLEQYTGDDLVHSYAQAHAVWGDCYKKEFDFFLKDFGSLLGMELDCAGYQEIAKVYLEMKTKGEECVITEDDIEDIFSFLTALSCHACRWVRDKRAEDEQFLSDFPLEEYCINFGI